MNSPLKPGTTLGHYEIRAQLGAGGMGEVYRARDPRLNRDVAIKILPGAFLLDRNRLSRFQREAHVLASLNHPNIAAIYGLEEQNGLRGLVLELVEGPTLADRIALGPIPPDEAVAIARQIAEAFEVAHERGIIDRDLKPANVKVTDDGVVKILDFGLAKVFTEDVSPVDLSQSPTVPKATDVGLIVGTAAYMSPEQAKGKAVDKRADIWAFGCVLFEMLSGKRAFTGETVTVAFDINSRRVTSAPVNLVFNVQLSISGNTPQFFVSDTGTLVYMPASSAQRTGTQLVAVSQSGQVSPIPAEPHDYSDPRVSPDGRFVAVHLQGEQNDVWVTDVSRGTVVRISFDGGEDETPAWSPDGKYVAWAGSRADVLRGIFRRRSDGTGVEELIWKLDNHAHVRDWTPDGHALVIEIGDPYMGGDIWRLDLEGTPSAAVYLKTQFNERSSRLSPDGHWLAYVSDGSGRDEIYVQSFPQAGSKVQVSRGGGDQPVWSRDGHKIFFRSEGEIQEITFQPTSPPSVSKAQSLCTDTFDNPQANGHTGYDVFPDGRFLMIQQTSKTDAAEIVVVVNWTEELKRLVPTGK